MGVFERLKRNFQRNILGIDPNYRDPYDDPAEQFYARIYLKYLFEKIDAEFRHQQAKILDLGCHTGRLAIPLARAGHAVTAIDSSRFHIRRAEEHARKAGVSSRFLAGDGFKLIRRFPPYSFDLVLSTEVLYQRPDFRELLKNLGRVVRPGGLLATSHRTRFFYLTRAVRIRDFETANFIAHHSEGTLWDSYFNWQSPRELRELYESIGFDLILARPIGSLTGNGGEGMGALCDLGQIEAAEREALFDLEAMDSEEFAPLGRYLFVIGRKREA